MNNFSVAGPTSSCEGLIGKASVHLKGLEGIESAGVGIWAQDFLRAAAAGNRLLSRAFEIVPRKTTSLHKSSHRFVRRAIFEGLVVNALIDQGPWKACMPER